MWKTPEYQNLLVAERVLVETIQDPEVKPKDRAMVASALRGVIEQKRILRGQPAPKPADKVKRSKPTSVTPMPTTMPLPPAQSA